MIRVDVLCWKVTNFSWDRILSFREQIPPKWKCKSSFKPSKTRMYRVKLVRVSAHGLHILPGHRWWLLLWMLHSWCHLPCCSCPMSLNEQDSQTQPRTCSDCLHCCLDHSQWFSNVLFIHRLDPLSKPIWHIPHRQMDPPKKKVGFSIFITYSTALAWYFKHVLRSQLHFTMDLS